MAIPNWHPGKIVLLWVIDLAVLLALWSFARPYGDQEAFAILFWLILSIPVFVITWKWLSKREVACQSREGEEEEHKQS